MCDFGIASIGLTMASGAMSAASAAQQGAASSSASAYQASQARMQAQMGEYNAHLSEYQAQVALRNKSVEEWNAQDITNTGVVEVGKLKTQQGLAKGTSVAALASQGTTMEGSPSDILGSQAKIDVLDQKTLRGNYAREAYSHLIKADDYGVAADMAKANASLLRYDASWNTSAAQFHDTKASQTAAMIPFSVATSLIGTAGQVAGKWYNFKKAGLIA